MIDPDRYTDFVAGRLSTHRSADHVRPLVLVFAEGDEAVIPGTGHLDAADPVWVLVQAVLGDGFGGVILSGPPGTSKSWYAANIASKLVGGRPERIRSVQFHPSYQYEDFVEGYVPDPSTGTFQSTEKHLMLLATEASQLPSEMFVLVIDELSRADPARVFGEALTYIEGTKRGREFYLASGRRVSIPANLFIVATMNEFDRGVDEVDAAFDRRMARIPLQPSAPLVTKFLATAGMPPALAGRVVEFFTALQRNPERAARIGHTFFMNLKSEDDLRRRWLIQLSHVLRKAFRLNPDGFREVEVAWNRIFAASPAPDASGSVVSAPAGLEQEGGLPLEPESGNESSSPDGTAGTG